MPRLACARADLPFVADWAGFRDSRKAPSALLLSAAWMRSDFRITETESPKFIQGICDSGALDALNQVVHYAHKIQTGDAVVASATSIWPATFSKPNVGRASGLML